MRSTTEAALPRLASRSLSNSCPRKRALRFDSTMVIPRPTATALMKKNTGSSGEYHSGFIFSGAIRNRVPRVDWCRVERHMPAMTSGSVIRRTIFNGHSSLNFSKTTGLNSSARTVEYKMTHHATSIIGEWMLIR